MSLSRPAQGSRSLAQGLLLLALCLPFIWPLDPGPGAKTASMLLAAGLWSATLLAAAYSGATPRAGLAAALFVAPALVVGAQAAGGMLAYPSQGWDTVALLLGAALVAGLGRRVASERDWLVVAGRALLLQGLLQVVIGLVQFALWQLPVVATSISAHTPWFYQFISFPGDGRIYGNLRQPNHYATALALGCAGLAAVAPTLRRRQVWAAALGLSWALEVSGSRTALAHTLLIAALVLLLVPGAWRTPRLRPLLALPLLYAAWWLLLRGAATLGWIHYLDAITRQLDQPVNARALIWHDALQVWKQHPWLGWGWGQIGWGLEQAAVTQHLHPLPLDNIDNAHDLVLQLLATCGVVGTAPVLLLVAALAWRLLRAPWHGGRRDAGHGAALLPALAGAGCIALHSLLEYPLWYLYFLFAFAFLLGWGEGVATDRGATRPARGAGRGVALAAAALMLGLSAKATLDYVRAADVYATTGAAADRARALSRRTNWFFVPLAEFADAAEVLPDPGDDRAELLDELAQLERASHVWGDPGLLSRRIIVLLRLHRDTQAVALARYTASAFWLYAAHTAADFGPLATEAGLAGGDPRVRQIEQILRTAPVLRRVVVPR